MTFQAGAILTARETDAMLRRLDAIMRKTADRRIRENCRLAFCDMQKAKRRGQRFREKKAEKNN